MYIVWGILHISKGKFNKQTVEELTTGDFQTNLIGLSDEDFATFHELVGDRPVMDADGIAAYQAKLMEARDILEAAYEFNAENVANW